MSYFENKNEREIFFTKLRERNRVNIEIDLLSLALQDTIRDKTLRFNSAFCIYKNIYLAMTDAIDSLADKAEVTIILENVNQIVIFNAIDKYLKKQFRINDCDLIELKDNKIYINMKYIYEYGIRLK